MIYSLNLKSYTKIVFHTCVHNVFSFLGVKKIEDPPCGSQDISKKNKVGLFGPIEEYAGFLRQHTGFLRWQSADHTSTHNSYGQSANHT